MNWRSIFLLSKKGFRFVKMIVFIKHIAIEGPETMGAFFHEKGFDVKIIELQRGEALPSDLSNVDAVISLGGPMNVYEEDRYTFLKEENEFLKKVIKKEIPFLGICLGSQLLAKACGVKVGKSPQKEVGFLKVHLTKKGREDPLFQGIKEEIDVYQWHEDMFFIPQKGELLAESTGCPHQAFKVGFCAYGLQFHIEITDQSVRDWSDAYLKEDDPVSFQKKQNMLKDYFEKKERFDQTAEAVYENFLKIIKQKSRNNTKLYQSRR